MIHSSNGILFSEKRNNMSNHKKDMEESLVHIAKQEKPEQKSCLLYDANYTTFWKRQNYREREKISDWGRRRGMKHRGFLG